MKRSVLILIIAMMTFAGAALAQAPERGQGERKGGGGQGGGRGGRGGGLPTPPALTGPVADLVNSIIAAINKQDTAYVQKVAAPDAWWADEDGHILPATFFIPRLMRGTPPKKLTPTNMGGQVWDNGAWAALDYTLDETLANGSTNQIKGTITMTFKKSGNDWLVALIHASVNGPAVAQH